MAGRLKLNRFDVFALAAAVVTSWLCLRAALDASEAYRMARPLTAEMQTLGLLGWAIATFGPMGLAVGFWRLSKRFRARWVIHLLFLPCAIALLLAGAELMLFVIGHRDFDDTLGGPVLQAALMLVLAVAAYFAAVVSSLLPFQAKRTGK
jgi:Mg/Co/Ni transporter MgtE